MMNANAVRDFCNQMDRETKSNAARKRMAETAIRFGKLTDCGRAAYVAYLEAF